MKPPLTDRQAEIILTLWGLDKRAIAMTIRVAHRTGPFDPLGFGRDLLGFRRQRWNRKGRR